MKFKIGIDEVGRGCLAGPIFVGVVFLAEKIRFDSNLGEIRDSKMLSEKRREKWVREFLNLKIKFRVARVYPRGIEKINISRAANLAAYRGWTSLIGELDGGNKVPVYLDGGLYLKKRGLIKHAKTIVRGDETVPAIMAASIIAKVARDKFMGKMSKKYPGYGFEVHKGYATKNHRKAIEKQGPCPIHRLTFLRNYDRMVRITDD